MLGHVGVAGVTNRRASQKAVLYIGLGSIFTASKGTQVLGCLVDEAALPRDSVFSRPMHKVAMELQTREPS